MNFSHDKKNIYRGTCKPDDPCCYVFVRYSLSRYQSCVNSLVAKMSVSDNYTGKVVGISKEVEVLEGCDWPEDKGVAVLEFACVCEAERWIQCTPVIKQHDWLGGDVDIVAVSVRQLPAQQKQWFQLIDLTHIENYDAFCYDYVEKVNPYLSGLGCTAATGVVASSAKHGGAKGSGGNGPKTLRGRWNPNTLIVNQFDSREAFDTAYCSEEYQPLKQKRQEVSRANVVLFNMIPLIHKKC